MKPKNPHLAKFRFSRSNLLALPAVFVCVTPFALHAATGDWVSATAGGNWTSNANWSASPNPTTGETATLGDATADRTITYDSTATATASGITFTFGALTARAGDIADPSTLRINGVGSRLSLAAGINDTVKALYIDGVLMTAGTWGSTTSSATNKNDSYFSGTGILTVTGTSAYDTWAASFGAGFTDTAAASNPDGDTLTNLQEYAFGTNPTLSSSGSIVYNGSDVTTPGLPVIVEQGGMYYAVFGRRADYLTAGISYTLQLARTWPQVIGRRAPKRQWISRQQARVPSTRCGCRIQSPRCPQPTARKKPGSSMWESPKIRDLIN